MRKLLRKALSRLRIMKKTCGFLNHCLHETCKNPNCKGNHTLNGHTKQCEDPYSICCICDKKIKLDVCHVHAIS